MKHESEKEYNKKGSSGGGGIPINDECVVVILVVVLAAVVTFQTIKRIGGTRVYVHPTGHPEYKQRIVWGKNKVWIPKSLKEKKFGLRVEMVGNYKGYSYLNVYSRQDNVELKEE